MKLLQKKKDSYYLPFFMPWVWHTVLAVALLFGIILGGWIAFYMLHIRGLL